MVAAGHFREDFYYRISVIPIHVPPLRARPEDIEPLARHFLRKFALQMGKPLKDFDRLALDALKNYSWPGNVRELENAIERAVAMSGEGAQLVQVQNLPESVTGSAALAESNWQIPSEGVDFEKQVTQLEERYLKEALRAADGVRTRAAEILRMSYRSFRHYAKKHNI